MGKIKYNKIMLRDEKDRIKMETCKNPNGETIASIVQSYPPPSFTDISFSSGVVPTSTLFFICPNEKLLSLIIM